MASESWQLDYKFKGEEVLILVLVEDGFRGGKKFMPLSRDSVLILVLVEDGFRAFRVYELTNGEKTVLILVLVEDGFRVSSRRFCEEIHSKKS